MRLKCLGNQLLRILNGLGCMGLGGSKLWAIMRYVSRSTTEWAKVIVKTMLSLFGSELTIGMESRGKVGVGFLGLRSLSFISGSARVTRSGVGFFCTSFPIMGVNGQGRFLECQDGRGLVIVDHVVLDTFSESVIHSA